MVERFNATLETNLRIMVINEHQTDWDRHIPMFLLAYRSAMHETTRPIPTSVVFGKELSVPADLLFERPANDHLATDQYVKHLSKSWLAAHKAVRKRTMFEGDRMRTKYDSV